MAARNLARLPQILFGIIPQSSSPAGGDSSCENGESIRSHQLVEPDRSGGCFTAAAEFLDATAWDNYVSAPGLSRFQRQYTSGLSQRHHAVAPARTSDSSAQSKMPTFRPMLRPEGLRLQAYDDLAHGSHGQLYFEWRRPPPGAKSTGRHSSRASTAKSIRTRPILERICKEMARLGPRLADATEPAPTSRCSTTISNAWAQGTGGVGGDRNPRYDGEMQSFYAGIKVSAAISISSRSQRLLSGYKIVVASNLRLIDDPLWIACRPLLRTAEHSCSTTALPRRTWITACGVAWRPGRSLKLRECKSEAVLDLFEYNSQNGQSRCRSPGRPRHPFCSDGPGIQPRTAIESLTLHGAEAIATVHGGGPMKGRPAITRNRHGRAGFSTPAVTPPTMISTRPGARGRQCCLGLKPLIASAYGVEVTSRQDATRLIIFC